MRFLGVMGGLLAMLFAGCGPATPPASLVPTLTAPKPNAVLANGRFDKTVTIVWDFSWSAVPGATEYHLWVARPTATYPLIDQGGIPEPSFHYTSAGSYIIAQNLPGWTWKVRARVNGQWQAWSQIGTFSVEPPNTAPRQ